MASRERERPEDSPPAAHAPGSPGVAAMKNYRLNRPWLAGTAVVCLAAAALTHAAHGWQMRGHARGQLALADQAEEDGRADDLAAALGRYLGFAPGDPAARAR